MPSRPRVFVSFSSRDQQFVRRLFAALRRQPVDLWDYSTEGQEIPGGVAIADYLRERVGQGDYFVPVVSANSMASRYTRVEVERALALAATGDVVPIPVVTAACAPEHEWPEPYASLANYRFYRLSGDSAAALEKVLERLCRDLGVEYVAPLMGDPHLPFLERLNRELDRRCPRRDERSISIYCRLEEVRDDLVEALEQQEFELARSRAEFITATCEYEYPDEPFYYPYVTKAVCLLLCGRLPRAQEVLRELLTHPDVDESTYAALGYVCETQGAYGEALAYYREAARLDPNDPIARRGAVLSAAMTGQAAALGPELDTLDACCVTDFDRRRARELRGFVAMLTGQFDAGVAVYRELIDAGHGDARMLVICSQAMWASGRRAEALDLLRAFAPRFRDDSQFLHHLALRAFQEGARAEAAEYFAELVQRRPPQRTYLADAAQTRWVDGDRRRARELAARLFADADLGLPAGHEDFYCDGLANWLLGRRERADYDFERSAHPAGDHYAHLLGD